MIRIQLETPILDCEISRRIDHSWLTFAGLVHARLYEERADEKLDSRVISKIERADQTLYIITIKKNFFWTDGEAISAHDVSRALAQGQSLIKKRLFLNIKVVSRHIVFIKTPPEIKLTRRLLSSPFFTLTPGCRHNPNKNNKLSSCGAFHVAKYAKDGLILQKNIHRTSPNSRQKIELFTHKDTEKMLSASLNRKGTTISASLGGSSKLLQAYKNANLTKNRATNIGMILRPNNSAKRAIHMSILEKISKSIDRCKLALETGHTFIPLHKLEELFKYNILENSPPPETPPANPDQKRLKLITLSYVDFYPNKIIAIECAKQIGNITGWQVEKKETNYENYLKGSPDNNHCPEFILEIVQPALPLDYYRGFIGIPILQALPTAIALGDQEISPDILTREGLFDWTLL